MEALFEQNNFKLIRHDFYADEVLFTQMQKRMHNTIFVGSKDGEHLLEKAWDRPEDVGS